MTRLPPGHNTEVVSAHRASAHRSGNSGWHRPKHHQHEGQHGRWRFSRGLSVARLRPARAQTSCGLSVIRRERRTA
jgi:hypothetical protein